MGENEAPAFLPLSSGRCRKLAERSSVAAHLADLKANAVLQYEVRRGMQPELAQCYARVRHQEGAEVWRSFFPG